MTGRDLIIFILQNGLEDKVLFENGDIPGFKHISTVAVDFGVGLATVEQWYELGVLPGIKIGNEIYLYEKRSEKNE